MTFTILSSPSSISRVHVLQQQEGFMTEYTWQRCMVFCSSSPASDFPMVLRLSSLDLPLLSTEFTFHFPINWKYLAMLQTCSTLETPPPGTPLPLVSSFLSFFSPFFFWWFSLFYQMKFIKSILYFRAWILLYYFGTD